MGHPALDRIHAGFGELLKVFEIDNTIFQDPESFGKGRFFKLAMEQFWILFEKILIYPKVDITFCCFKHCIDIQCVIQQYVIYILFSML